ncbi:MAG: hypothetical protein P8I03_09730 [Thalassotalea sp.]|nr:hypothetical protein [Thalassotalea sp.]
MLKGQHFQQLANVTRQNQATDEINRSHNEVRKGNNTIRNLSAALEAERAENRANLPLLEAMTLIRNFENNNPYWVVSVNILESAHRKWHPKHTNEVVNPNSPPDSWKLSVLGKRNHNLYLIALAEVLYNTRAAPRNALEWTNWLLTHADVVPEEAFDELHKMNERVANFSSSPTLDIGKRVTARFNILQKSVKYSDEYSTVPLTDSLPNHNEDCRIEEIVGKTDGQKTVATKKNITECDDWQATTPLFHY